jgi:hypothetical protein
MKSILMAALLALATPLYASPILSDITGNPAHTETDGGFEVFGLTDTTGSLDDATAFLLIENAGFAPVNAFGIYGAGGIMLEVFAGALSPLTSATLAWDIATDVVTNLATGNFATISDQAFGFYLESGDGNTYYSQSALNPSTLDMMLAFDVNAAGHPDLLGSNVILAFEDISGSNSDWDYNDMVVGVSDIAPSVFQIETIPEPLPLAMIGAGLLGLGAYTRRKRYTI